MENEPITMAAAFDLEKEAAGKADALKKSESFQDVRKKMSEKFAGLKLPAGFYDGLFELLIKNLNDLLAIDIPKDILAGAWKKQKVLQQYRDPEKYPPGTRSIVSLAEHTLKTSHEPSMEVSVFGQTLGTLAVTLEASFVIKPGILEVEGGRIKKIQTGDIEGTGHCNFMGVPVMETKTVTIHLPGVYDLKEGVEITA